MNKHIVNRLGLNDAFSAQELIYLFKENILPAFTILYFPENDHPVHKKGPGTLKGLKSLINSFKNMTIFVETSPLWTVPMHLGFHISI